MTIKMLMPYGRNTLYASNAWLGGTIILDLAFGKSRALYHATLQILHILDLVGHCPWLLVSDTTSVTSC